jgi:hypothetical protein
MWLGIVALLPSGMYVSARCLVMPKGSAFGPPKWGEHGGGHGVHASKGAEWYMCRSIKPSRLGFWGAGVLKGPNWLDGVNNLI